MIRAFISYSHDSTEHKDRVWDLCERLRKDGIDCRIDQHEFSPPEGWPRWCRNQIQESQFVLVVCTVTYNGRYEGKGETGKGQGAKWEGFVITQELYEAEGKNTKFIPVVFSIKDTQYIPTELRAATRYALDGQDDYENLLRHLTNQPAQVKSDVAPEIRSIPPQRRRQTFSGPLWNVPLRRNPFFTGRGDELKEVQERLRSSGIVALTGIGGTGKTETAVEYAYRHRDEYSAVLWAGAKSRETLLSDFSALAKLLNLPLKDEPDQILVAGAVKRWLAGSTGWLLILDNVDGFTGVQEFVPSPSQGHVLLTAQSQATGAVHGISITDMLPHDGALLLLRRAKKIKADDEIDEANESDRATARLTSTELGGLPLALDQAAAYIEETGCGLKGYLELYRQRHSDLLRRRGFSSPSHPDSVATTFTLSFERVESANKAAADLLRLSAFLYPDAIPEEILTMGAPELGPVLSPAAGDPLELNAAFAETLKYSLLRRDPEARTFRVHRLVQTVLRDSMEVDSQRQWAERAVKAVYLTFPEGGFPNWPRCERWLPQAHTCAALAAGLGLMSGQLAWVLNQAGSYLLDRGRYAEAEPLCRASVRIWEKVCGPEDLDLAAGLSNLAGLYHVQGISAAAEPMYKRALKIKEGVLGSGHPDVASGLKSLASLYREEGRYAEAEPLFRRALAIRERALGPGHPDVAASLNGLAVLLSDQGKYAEAEPLYERALAIREKALDPGHPDLAMSLSNLATLLIHQGKDARAELLLQRALEISERALGPDHPNVATCLNSLASLYGEQRRFAEAEPLYLRALAIREQALGPEHPLVANVLQNYAKLLREEKRITAAKELV